MTLLYTATIGTALWWIAALCVDTRYTMGKAGPWLYAGVFVFVLTMTLRVARQRHAMAANAPSAAQPRFPTLLLIRSALLVALPILLIIAIGFSVGRIYSGGDAVMYHAFVVAVAAVPIAALVGWAGRRLQRAAASGNAPIGSSIDASIARSVDPSSGRRGELARWSGPELAAALSPLLVPLAALLLLRHLSAGPWWEVRTDGPPRAGLLYIALVPIMLPSALLVAWGIDRLDGSRGGRLAGVCAGLSLAALVAAVGVLPSLLYGLEAGDPTIVPSNGVHLPLYGLHGAFHTVIPDAPVGTGTAPLLPLTDFFHAAAAMMAIAAAATAHALRQLGRGVRLITPLRAALMLALQVLLTLLLMPQLGPVGAPLAAVGALLAASLPVLLLRGPSRSAASMQVIAGTPTAGTPGATRARA